MERDIEFFVQLRPTSPIRDVFELGAAIEKLRVSPDFDSLRMVVPTPFNALKTYYISPDEDVDKSPLEHRRPGGPTLIPLVENVCGVREPYLCV